MLTSPFSTRARRATLVALSVGAIGYFATGASMQSPRFYPDDPLAREPESQDASKAAPYDQSQIYELGYNLFVTSGYQPSGLRAKNINTIDEVPDSSWFTNRVGSRPVTTEELVRAGITGAPPDPSKWTLIREKTAGAHPGFTAMDGKGETWFLEFDPPWAPGRGNRRRRDCHQDFLGARLQPGRVVPDDLRSEEGDDRPEGDDSPSQWQADALHAG